MQPTEIAWTDCSWNPVRGCRRVSPGCEHCYAELLAARFSKPGMWGHGFAQMTKAGPRWTGKVALVPEKLNEPLRLREPRRIFVNSTSDLFHEDLSWERDVSPVLDRVGQCERHTFQVLTKRAANMRACMVDWYRRTQTRLLANLWLGVSVENRAQLERVEHLRMTPATLRFLSIEPLLEDIGALDLRGIGWVIVGGESGPGARTCDVAWTRSVVRQCRAAGVACFVKQLGARVISDSDDDRRLCGDMNLPHPFRMILHSAKGGDMDEWPEDLRVREMPK